MQPPSFKGERPRIEKDTKIWIEAMDDYFLAAGTWANNQFMLARSCLTSDAKLWWRQYCCDKGVTKQS